MAGSFNVLFDPRLNKRLNKQSWPVNSPHKWPLTRKMFPFDNVIMKPKVTGVCIYLSFNLLWIMVIVYLWLYHCSMNFWNEMQFLLSSYFTIVPTIGSLKFNCRMLQESNIRITVCGIPIQLTDMIFRRDVPCIHLCRVAVPPMMTNHYALESYTVKPVYNDHLMGHLSAFWSSCRWPRAT